MKKIKDIKGKNQQNKGLLQILHKKQMPVSLNVEEESIQGAIGFGSSPKDKPFFVPMNPQGVEISSGKHTNIGYHFILDEELNPFPAGYPIHLNRMDITNISPNKTEFSARITYYNPDPIRADANFTINH